MAAGVVGRKECSKRIDSLVVANGLRPNCSDPRGDKIVATLLRTSEIGSRVVWRPLEHEAELVDRVFASVVRRVELSQLECHDAFTGREREQCREFFRIPTVHVN